jgi:L-fuconolactonase
MSDRIIDTHTHFFDPTRAKGVPWPPADDEVLYKPTYPDRFLDQAEPHGVTGTVVVEASSWLEDNQWILDLAQTNPTILGLIGNLDVFDARFVENLDRFAANPLFRGIRLGQTALHQETLERLIPALKELASRDLALDLLVHPGALPSVVSIADMVPGLRIVLDHVVHVGIDGRAPDESWVKGITACGQRDHIFCKVSGLVEASVASPAPSEPSYYRPTLDALVASFGTGKLAYGSNWPVCEKYADYATAFSVPRAYFNAMGSEVADAVFRKNALASYRCVESRTTS